MPLLPQTATWTCQHTGWGWWDIKSHTMDMMSTFSTAGAPVGTAATIAPVTTTTAVVTTAMSAATIAITTVDHQMSACFLPSLRASAS